MKNILITVAGIAAVVFFFWALVTGVNKSEQVECSEWREQAAQFPAWYSTQWQREQCIAHGLPLPR